ncbi:Uncharacterised protein [Moraxella caprae]|uniref:Toxin-antitoxin system toxin component, PIN family n=1 Tax=Moraxella caprae TaxID=90240 RepID=A0A378U598_9GAMM|nr:PIN domain-containing protein [Moraxella caprae]STZ70286.1 Uncharacterised protein [Moraxella caprae]
MKENNKIVIDTNLLISAVLFPNSLPAKAVDEAMYYWQIVVSESTLNEFFRSDFKKEI